LEGAAPLEDYLHPSVTADVVLLAMRGDMLSVLLAKRRSSPIKGAWAILDGFVAKKESPERMAI